MGLHSTLAIDNRPGLSRRVDPVLLDLESRGSFNRIRNMGEKKRRNPIIILRQIAVFMHPGCENDPSSYLPTDQG